MLDVSAFSSSNSPCQVHFSKKIQYPSSLFFFVFGMIILEKVFWKTYSRSNSFLKSLFQNIFSFEQAFLEHLSGSQKFVLESLFQVQVLLQSWLFVSPIKISETLLPEISYLTFCFQNECSRKSLFQNTFSLSLFFPYGNIIPGTYFTYEKVILETFLLTKRPF